MKLSFTMIGGAASGASPAAFGEGERPRPGLARGRSARSGGLKCFSLSRPASAAPAAAPRGAFAGRARGRDRLQDLLSIDRAARRADRSLRHGDRAARTGAGGPSPRGGLGASDDRRRSPLRAVAGAQAIRDDCRTAADAGARLCGGGDGLSGPRHAGDPSLSRRRQRGSRGARLGARRAPNSGRRRRLAYVVWGHSQGGQAALFTGLLSQSYAPDLQLLGVAAAAPATELATLMKADLDTSGGRNLTAMTLWSWKRVLARPRTRCSIPPPFRSSTGWRASASSRSSTFSSVG